MFQLFHPAAMMLYSVALLIVIGIISCSGHWIVNQKIPTNGKQRWNINSDFNSVIPKENEFDFQNTYEFLGNIPLDISKISEYLGNSITLEDFTESESPKFEEQVRQFTFQTQPKRLIDERPLVPIREQVDEGVQLHNYRRVETRRPALISKDNTWPSTIREENTWPSMIREHSTRSQISPKYLPSASLIPKEDTERNEHRRPIFDYERKLQSQ